MNTKMIRLATAALLVTGVSAAANAEYRCDPAPTWADRKSCEAAAQGPTELRRTVQSMNSIRINQRFEHYVNDATAAKWAQAPKQTELAEKSDSKLQVASAQK